MRDEVGTVPRRLRSRQISSAILERTGRAQRRILLISPFMNPTRPLLRALLEACERGVAVKLRFSASKAEEYRRTDWLRRIVAAGGECEARANFHFKTYLFDHVCIDTSMNLTSGGSGSIENGIIFRLDRGPDSKVLLEQLRLSQKHAVPVVPLQPPLPLPPPRSTPSELKRCPICGGPSSTCLAREHQHELTTLLTASIAAAKAARTKPVPSKERPTLRTFRALSAPLKP